MKTKPIVLLALLLAFAMLSTSAQAAVLRAVRVETNDVAAYAKQIEVARQIMAKAGSVGVLRVWVGRYAGTNAGSVVVTVEYPDMMSLAKDHEELYKKNEDFKAWLARLSGMRKIVSDTIYEEASP